MPEATFIEDDCTIEHEGRTFKSGGSWLCDCSDGYRRGVVYVKPPKIGYDTTHLRRIIRAGGEHPRSCYGFVTTWHGEQIAGAGFGPIYQGNFCRMRAVTFTFEGVTFTGRYCPESSQAVRVKSTRKVPV
jgi:hypothetical protein